MSINRITAAKVGAYGIATVAAVASFGHQVHLLEQADLDPLFGFIPSEWVTPLTVDLLAMVALAVRTSDTVTERTRKAALLPLILAGGLSVAANVAEARNIVQIVVGVWTVAAYILAELFVQKMERKSEAPAAPAKPTTVRVTEAERLARKRAGYKDMSKAEKMAWTKSYRDRTARRIQSAAPTSPGRVPVDAPSADEVEAIAS
jgi:hypothetical protein